MPEEDIEIGAGLGPLAGKVWRIGLMGYSCRTENVEHLLSALEGALTDLPQASASSASSRYFLAVGGRRRMRPRLHYRLLILCPAAY